VMGEAAPSASVLGDRVVARAQKQRASGREERVADDATFSSTLAAALQSEASVARKQDGVATRASALSARADDLLTTVDRDFTSRKARDEVARELNAAKLILHAAALRTRTVANDADAFVKAASAARQAAPRAEPVAAAPPKDRKRARGKTPRPSADVARPSRPAAEAPRPARPAPEVPPPPPAKPADDFNP
jgi:hypothetical protein